MATLQSDIFKPTKYGGKYTATLIPGMSLQWLRTVHFYQDEA